MKVTSTLGVATICLALTACSKQGEIGANYLSGTTVQELPEGELLVVCVGGIHHCYSRITAHCPEGFNEIERISQPKKFYQNEITNIRFKCK